MANKLLTYIRRLYKASGQYRKRDIYCTQLPVRLWVEVTNVCNLRCVICPNSKDTETEPKGYMKDNLFKEIINQTCKFANDINFYARGESLLHPGLPWMIEYAVSKGLRTRLETNATVLDSKKSQAILDSGLDFLSFSFDGYSKEVYEKIRKGSDYDKTLNNIIQFLEIKKAKNKTRPYTLVQIIETPLLLKDTRKDQKKEFMDRFKNLPLNGVKIIPAHRFAGSIEEQITGTRFAYMDKKSALRYLVKLKYTPCPYPWYGLTVLWDGRIMPCCLNFFDIYEIGNINQDTIQAVWNNEYMKRLREALRLGKYKEISMCAECDFLWQRSILGISTKNFKDFIMFMKEAL